MRKVLRRIIVLCMACMICMSGLCMAKFIKDDDGNWVEFYREDEKPWNIYFVDTNAIKVCEYEGKKYLDVSIRRKENTVENYVYYIHQTEVTNAKFHRLLDLENRKKHNIEWQNKYAKQKRGTADISEIKNGKSFTPWDEKLVTWVEQNYPAVINEIRTFNHSGQSAPNTNVTGAAGGQAGTMPDIVDNFSYEVLESGAVRFFLRCKNESHEELSREAYYIFTKPAQFKDLPGTYMAGWLADDDTIVIDNVNLLGHAFDYDAKTQVFTFYGWTLHAFGNLYDINIGEDTGYIFRTRLIDKNTVYNEYFGGNAMLKEGVPKPLEAVTYKYMPYTSIPIQISKVEGSRVEAVYPDSADGHSVSESCFYDDNQCVWFGDGRRYRDNYHFFDLGFGTYYDITAKADMIRAFLAVNGKIGEIPYEVRYNWYHE